jgi:ferredoxin
VASFNHASAAARILNVDQFPDTVTLAWFEQHHVCKRCGSTASVCSKNAVYNPALLVLAQRALCAA